MPSLAVAPRPCANCPFKGGDSYLRRDRRAEIAQALQRGQSFHCHETVDYDDHADGTENPGTVTADSKECAGAVILTERSGGSQQMVRIAERLGMMPAKLDDAAVPWADLEDWVTQDDDEDEPPEPCYVVEEGCEAPAGWDEGGAIVSSYLDAGNWCTECGESVCDACLADTPGERGVRCRPCSMCDRCGRNPPVESGTVCGRCLKEQT